MITSLPRRVCSRSVFTRFVESLDDKPEVGSSTNSIAGSRINSIPMFNLLRCPPLIILRTSVPTFKSLMSYKSSSSSTFSTVFLIFSSE